MLVIGPEYKKDGMMVPSFLVEDGCEGLSYQDFGGLDGAVGVLHDDDVQAAFQALKLATGQVVVGGGDNGCVAGDGLVDA